MTPAMFDELIAVTALANATNRLANGYRIDVDERFASPLAPVTVSHASGGLSRADEPPRHAVLLRTAPARLTGTLSTWPFIVVTCTSTGASRSLADPPE